MLLGILYVQKLKLYGGIPLPVVVFRDVGNINLLRNVVEINLINHIKSNSSEGALVVFEAALEVSAVECTKSSGDYFHAKGGENWRGIFVTEWFQYADVAEEFVVDRAEGKESVN